MRTQPPPESLGEFEPEDRLEADPRPEVAISGSILDVVAAASPADTAPAPLSRLESRRARKRASHLKRLARGTARAWAATVAHAGMVSQRAREHVMSAVSATGRASGRMAGHTVSGAHAAGHVCARAWSSVRSAAAATRQHTSAAVAEVNGAWTQAWSSARPHFGARTTARTMLEDLEFNGTIIAMSLAMAALAYGGFRVGPRPAPAVPLAARAIEAVPIPAAPSAAVVAVPPDVLPVPPAETAQAHVAARPVKAVLNTTTLNAIWRRQDSRSLQQAFTGLRSQTLAFHRCGMRMTDTDRAVATCEGAQRAKWTINFRRSAGRWQIDRVITR